MKNGVTVGELAKKVNVTVRTLQYYDKIDLLKPTSISEGGRRLYDDMDIAKVHQIITLKSFGLSLKEIKDHLTPLENNIDVHNMLSHQTSILEEQISKATKLLESIQMMKNIEIKQDIDWSKYSNMVKLIQENNEYYWVVKHLEEDMVKQITRIHESNENELPIDWFIEFLMKAAMMSEKGFSPTCSQAQELASTWWEFVMKYSEGENKNINKLYQFYISSMEWPEDIGYLKDKAESFIKETLEYFLETKGIKIEGVIK
jgi:DNA-binding transcriptional MerR regulator